jgi:hypothetical protein
VLKQTALYKVFPTYFSIDQMGSQSGSVIVNLGAGFSPQLGRKASPNTNAATSAPLATNVPGAATGLITGLVPAPLYADNVPICLYKSGQVY